VGGLDDACAREIGAIGSAYLSFIGGAATR
jgi:hypothetical protein